MAIKNYSPIIIVYYKDIDWSIAWLSTSLTNKERLYKAVNNTKVIDVEWVIISSNDVKQIREPESDLSELFFTQPRHIRNSLINFYWSYQNITKLSINKLQQEIERFNSPKNYQDE